VSALVPIVALSAAGAVGAVLLWVWLSRLLRARIRSRLRAAPLAAPLLLLALGYGLYWLVFFASPTLAVQMHAARLTISYFLGPLLPWFAGVWLLLSGWALLPLVRR
jgi:hypothetical protein